jgi:hypothetical protein
MAPTLSSSLVWKRALLFLLVPLPLLAVCMHFRQGVLGLLLLPLGFWPFPFRCHLEAGGIRVSWFVMSERLNWDAISRVELAEDRRPGVIGKRGSVLALERQDGSRMSLRGRAEVLAELMTQIEMHVRRDARATRAR